MASATYPTDPPSNGELIQLQRWERQWTKNRNHMISRRLIQIARFDASTAIDWTGKLSYNPDILDLREKAFLADVKIL